MSLQFSVGQRLKATIVEIPSENEYIVGYQGQLFRVRNSTFNKYKKGEQLDLVVVNLMPLQLKLYSDYRAQFNRFA